MSIPEPNTPKPLELDPNQPKAAKPYPQPHIYTTQQWGAVFVSSSNFGQTKPIHPLLHHMDWPNRTPEKDPQKALQLAFQLARDCQNDHMRVNGWADTGQQFTISIDGIILEGRHGSIAALQARHGNEGAQCEGYNSYSIGTEHEGTYDVVSMPIKQWEASVKLHAWICDRLGLQADSIQGHRDHCSTDCPGKWLYAQLPKFRKAVHDELTAWREKNPA